MYQWVNSSDVRVTTQDQEPIRGVLYSRSQMSWYHAQSNTLIIVDEIVDLHIAQNLAAVDLLHRSVLARSNAGAGRYMSKNALSPSRDTLIGISTHQHPSALSLSRSYEPPVSLYLGKTHRSAWLTRRIESSAGSARFKGTG